MVGVGPELVGRVIDPFGEPLDGKTILIRTEQGLGDSIQLMRYIPKVVESGGNVIIESHQRPMDHLFRKITDEEREDWAARFAGTRD